MKEQFSLKTKLVALCLGLLLLLGATSLSMMHHLGNLQGGGDTDGFNVYVQSLTHSIAAQFYERYTEVQTYSKDAAIRSMDKAKAAETLNEFSKQRGVYDLIMVVDATGKLIAVNDKSPDGNTLKTEPLFEKNYSDTPWFKAAIAGTFTDDESKNLRGTFFEDIQMDPYATQVYGVKKLGTSFSTVIKDLQGKVLGVITTRASSRWFGVAFEETFDLLQKQKLSDSKLTLLNKDGVLLYEYSSASAQAKSEDLRYDWERLLKPAPGRAETERASYGPVNSPKFIQSIGWSVVMSSPAAQTFSKVSETKNKFYVVLFLLVTLSAVLTVWFSNRISKDFMELAKRLATDGAKVQAAAGEISRSSGELSDASVKQASAIQQTAASIDEVSAMVKKNSENAAQSHGSSQQTKEFAERGQRSVQKMIQAVNEISDSNAAIMNQVAEGNQKIGEIVKLISEIGLKTKVINEIVFQTKLLSFNASVEAARAGEHGKGFAVVAEEVGNLARMSGNAAKEISDLLEGSIQTVEGIISQTKNSIERLVSDGKIKVETGKDVARDCGEVLSQIFSAAEVVDGTVAEIASASREQAQGVDEINKAMNQLDQVTQQNTSLSQRSAESALELNRQSKDLSELVQDLSFMVTGRKRKAHPPGKVEAPVMGARENVIPFVTKTKLKAATSAKKAVSRAASPKVAAGQNLLPQHDDPRFEDV